MAAKKEVKKESKKAAPAPATKTAVTTKPPKGFNGTQADWNNVSPAGKVYHMRKSEGLCVRCGKKAVNKKDGTPGLMCKDHLDYIRSFSAKNGEDTPPAGKTTGKAAKAQKKATTVVAKGKGKKAYQQLGVKQLKDKAPADQHMEAIAEE